MASEADMAFDASENAVTSVPLDQMTAEQMRARCIAPVKKEYLIRLEEKVSVSAMETNEGSSASKRLKTEANTLDRNPALVKQEAEQLQQDAAVNGQRDDTANREQEDKVALSEGNDRKRPRGQNHDRKSNVVRRPESAKTLCFSISKDLPCTYGDKCRYSHDVEAYLAAKPPDLGTKCVLFEQMGRCPYGIMCRFASSHTVDSKSVVLEERVQQWQKTECNGISPERHAALRKKTLALPLADAFIKLWNKECEKRDKECGTHGPISIVATPSHFASTPSTAPATLHTTLPSEQPQAECSPTASSSSPSLRNLPSPTSTEALSPIQPPANNHSSHPSFDSVDPEPSFTCMPTSSPSHPASQEGMLPLDSSSPLPLHSSSVATHQNGKHTPSSSSSSKVGAPVSCFDTAAVVEDMMVTPVVDEVQSRTELRQLFNESKPTLAEKKKVDFRNKLYLAPLTTVGNLPFRRLCKSFGADITCGEMAMAHNLINGQKAEWALTKRHASEDCFGVQVCGSSPEIMAKCAEVLEKSDLNIDFVDVNCGCPIDLVCHHGGGSALMERPRRLEGIVRGMSSILSVPVTVKLRTGPNDRNRTAHKLISQLGSWGASAVTLHGRTKQQRYTKLADWSYIEDCAAATDIPLIGNGDVLTFEDVAAHLKGDRRVSSLMIARGALVKPWVFTEAKEMRYWDISASERMDMLRSYADYGLEHWGSDDKGVQTTRRFLLEWMAFLHRYIPVGLLEILPPRLNERPPPFIGRNDLETLMASEQSKDWIKISEMLLGPTHASFKFLPKHKSNSYESSNG